ncbi:MAG: hypothetical protein K2Q45_00365 [Nitrosomonas sp.]|nr:hypothetical protein [Nitrosomonas sp.]
MQDLEDPSRWDKGFNIGLLKHVEHIGLPWIKSVFDQLVDAQVNSLFEETPTTRVPKRQAEVVALEENQVQKDIAQANTTSVAASAGSSLLKRSKTDAESVIQDWFDTFTLNGKSGHIGLVPESLQDYYPVNAPTSLDPVVKDHIIHFYLWLQKQQ